eukprot:TRINITY_DN1892_c0_g1_i4.p1 TRINITY_DN1892_c0_g1~~TRINITY_DN1892_c0_g1_i4.p1  ORF type:complete len:246 (+),score=24.12 TRINITY_DN1892_c0_g1_i4:130-867(+)
MTQVSPCRSSLSFLLNPAPSDYNHQQEESNPFHYPNSVTENTKKRKSNAVYSGDNVIEDMIDTPNVYYPPKKKTKLSYISKNEETNLPYNGELLNTVLRENRVYCDYSYCGGYSIGDCNQRDINPKATKFRTISENTMPKSGNHRFNVFRSYHFGADDRPALSVSSSSSIFPKKESKIKRRCRTSPEQLKILESVYQGVITPNKELRERLAQRLNMTARRVQIWFQNKRAKEKRLKKSFSNSYMC